MKYIQIIYIVAFLSLLPNLVWGQAQQTLSGRLVDTTGQGLQGAVVVLMTQTDSIQIGFEYIERDTFRIAFKRPAHDALLLYFSAVGYNSKYVPVDSTQTDLGNIVMEPLSIFLTEAKVDAKRPIGHEYKDGKDTYTIPEWLSKREYDLNSLLSHIPGLVYNGKSIEIAGIGSPIYTINGIMPLPGELNALYPEEIESVTIIRMPSAAHSKNTLGVINITTKETWRDYVSLRVQNTFDYSNVATNNSSATLNITKDKFSQALIYTYGYNASEYEQSDHYETSIPEENFHYQMESFTTMKENGDSHNLIFAPRFKINSQSHIDFQYNFNQTPNRHADGKNETHYTDSIQDKSLNTTKVDMEDIQHSAILRYDNRFDGKKRLTINAAYTSIEDIRNNAFFETGMLGNRIIDSTQMIYSQSYKNRGLLSSIKYEHQLMEHLQLESGVTYSNLWINSHSDYQDNTMDSKYKVHDEQILAYLNIGHSIGDFYYQLGVRGEYEYRHKTLSRNSGDDWYFMPVVGLSYKINNQLNFMLYYRRNVNYPTASQLNINKTYAQKYWYFTGNPDLKPSKEHSFMFRAALPYDLFLTCNYYLRKNEIFRSYGTDNADPRVIVSRPENIEKTHTLQTTLSWYKRLDFYYSTWNATYHHYFAKSPFIASDMKHKPIFSFNTMQSFTITPYLRASLYIACQTAGNNYTDYVKPQCSMSADMQFNLWRNRLHIKIAANSFVSINDGHSDTRFKHTHTVSHHDYHPRTFTLGISYQFRKFTEIFHKNEAGDEIIKRIN